jgi:hypothetical protein
MRRRPSTAWSQDAMPRREQPTVARRADAPPQARAPIVVSIGTLVVDRELVASGALEQLESQLSAELARLLAQKGVAPALHGATIPSLPARSMGTPSSPHGMELGRQLAHAVHASLSSGLASGGLP